VLVICVLYSYMLISYEVIRGVYSYVIFYHMLTISIQYTQVLIDHVCAFVENNQVQWLDLHSRPMKFKRSAILMEVMISLSCYTFKEKYTGKSALVLFCHMNPSDTCSNICYYHLSSSS